MSIFIKLLQIQAQAITIGKDGQNPHFRSKYITLDNIIAKISPILSDIGIVCHHTSDGANIKTILTDAETGENVESIFPLSGSTPQQIGSSITYGKRYNLSALLNICSDEDDDGNIASQITTHSQATVQDAKDVFNTDDLPWMTDENKNNLIKAIRDGKIQADGKEAVRLARKKYKVSKKMALEIETALS